MLLGIQVALPMYMQFNILEATHHGIKNELYTWSKENNKWTKKSY